LQFFTIFRFYSFPKQDPVKFLPNIFKIRQVSPTRSTDEYRTDRYRYSLSILSTGTVHNLQTDASVTTGHCFGTGSNRLDPDPSKYLDPDLVSVNTDPKQNPGEKHLLFILECSLFLDPAGPQLLKAGSGFNEVSGSGSVFGIRIQEGKNGPQK
jgi:hypothetical protein